MSDGWSEINIGKSAYLRGRIGWQGLRADEFIEEGPYLVTGTDFEDGSVNWSTCYHVSEARFQEGAYIHLRDGDLLITKDGTIGKVAYVRNCPQKAVLNSGVFLLRAKDATFNHRFLYHVLQSHLFSDFIRQNLAGSTINHLYQYVFERFSFLAPNDDEQARIADVLDSIDDEMRALQTLIAKQERIRAGLLQDLFTRGVDQNGALRPPREEAPHLYHQTELGWLPKGWSAPLLDSVAQRVSGHTPNRERPEYWNGGVKWVSLADSPALDDVYIDDTTNYISHQGIQNSSAVLHPAGLVLISRDAGVGKSAITTSPMAVSQHFMAWICGKAILNTFLYYQLQARKREFEGIAMGSTIPTIGLPYFKKLRVKLPNSEDEQAAIARTLLSIDQARRDNLAQGNKLRALKSALMQDLLTGRVSVAPLLQAQAA